MRCRLAHLLTLAVALAVSGCGAEAVPDENGQATKAIGSARFETVTRSTFGSEEYVVRSIGVYDYANDRREATSSYPTDADGTQKSTHTIEIGMVSWWELPQSESLELGGKRWLRYDSAESEFDIDEGSGLQVSEDGMSSWSRSVSVAPATDVPPDAFFEYLEGIAPVPERVGEENVRGVATARYRTSLDITRVLRRQFQKEGWSDQRIAATLDALPAQFADLEFWIGADGLVRRYRWRDKDGEAPHWSSETTTEFFDFGVESDIQPPPEHEVADHAVLLRLVQTDQDESEYEYEILPSLEPPDDEG